VITVLGASGFVGSHLVAELDRAGMAYRAPERNEPLDSAGLGDVVYCAGITTDLGRRPLDVVASHVGHLESVLRTGRGVSSVVYLSSTRLYRGRGAAVEDSVLELDPANPDRLYDVSKAMGEALALSSGIPALVLRLAHVFGINPASKNFLPSLLRDAVNRGEVTLQTSLESTRNYVGVDDVARSIVALVRAGATGIFNIAGTRAVSHGELTGRLSEITGCAVRVTEGAPTETAPDISIARVSAAIDYAPEPVLDALPRLVDGYRERAG